MADAMRATVATLLKGIDRYQFNPGYYQTNVTAQILLKALTNLPHTDFMLFVCHVVGATYQTIPLEHLTQLLGGVPDSQVKQWINKYGWHLGSDFNVFISNQEDNIKTKNITEKITFDSVAAIMASHR
ncbi:EIF3K-like protein [Mya arenaria]|uniref:EIF3K-like protein n=1 Tax=Mya arenaria TaxID=6604 RepID=A0ABY7FEQ2_MYAAR|nr:EIF3K-like protein [Mya arenaria]